jgi:hypothetical protein
MDSVNRIITAKDYATRDGVRTVRERIKKLAHAIRQRSSVVFLHLDEEPRGFAVFAEIDFGQWIGRCACGGCEFVDPGEPIFMCFGCGNRDNAGYLRPVIFPAERAEIERLVLERPVNDVRGLDDLDRAYQARPLVFAQMADAHGSPVNLPLSRSWAPGESVHDLVQQNKAIHAWQASQKTGDKA